MTPSGGTDLSPRIHSSGVCPAQTRRRHSNGAKALDVAKLVTALLQTVGWLPTIPIPIYDTYCIHYILHLCIMHFQVISIHACLPAKLLNDIRFPGSHLVWSGCPAPPVYSADKDAGATGILNKAGMVPFRHALPFIYSVATIV